MDKDYITVASSNGTTEEMEVVATFRLEETAKDCLIYNINTNEIIISEEDTKDCISDVRCQIIIGIL